MATYIVALNVEGFLSKRVNAGDLVYLFSLVFAAGLSRLLGR